MKYLVLALLAGCSSLVSDPCASGYHLATGTCLQDQKTHGNMPPNGTMEGPDASVDQDGSIIVVHPPMDGQTVQPQDASSDAPPDAMVCPLPTTMCSGTCVDLSDDPYNCGHCGRTCSSGICAAGTCIGDLPGHIVVIGHDYVASDPAMDRVIANGVTLSVFGSTARVGWWRGTATQEAGISAVARGLAQTGHTSQTITVATIDSSSLESLDAIVVEPQVGDGDAAEAAGAAAAASLATYLTASHTVVVMETTAGVSYRWLHGSGLLDLAPPVDASASQVSVVNAGDAVATGVVSPYFAKPGSVGFAAAPHVVVTDSSGDGVVIHATY